MIRALDGLAGAATRPNKSRGIRVHHRQLVARLLAGSNSQNGVDRPMIQLRQSRTARRLQLLDVRPSARKQLLPPVTASVRFPRQPQSDSPPIQTASRQQRDREAGPGRCARTDYAARG